MISWAVPARPRGLAVAFGALGAALATAYVLTGGRELALPALRLDFLWQQAGFQIAESLIPAGPADPLWRVLLAGVLNTLLAASIAVSLAIPIGIALALGREAPARPLAWCATGIVEAIRNTPVLLQLFLWYAIVTQALPGPREALEILPGVLLCNRGLFLPWFAEGGIDWPRLGGFNISGGLALSPEMTVLAGGLALFHGCYLAEIFRAGIRAVPAGQHDAARALSLGRVLAFRKVVLPQALGFALPSVAVQVLALLKNTSLAVAIGFPDFVGTLATVVNRNGRALEGLVLTAIVFLAINAALGAVIDRLARRPGAALTVEPGRASGRRAISVGEIAFGLALLAISAPLLWNALRWGVLDAVWTGQASACAAAAGACWAVVPEKARLLLFGLYPAGETWRAALAAALVVAAAIAAMSGGQWSLRRVVALVVGGLAIPLWLLGGGAGLRAIPSSQWGGLSLTIALAASVVVAASAAAIPLALARMSGSAWIALPARGAIELFRSVPLVALLLAADLLLPQFLPAGAEVPKLLRAFAAVALLATVNLAEVLRGALRSVPPGQREGARALGLSRQATFLLVVLPQALRIATPAAVNVYVGAIKDTSLVVIVGIFDVTGAAKAAMADPSWMRYAPELYLLLAATYFSICFPIARFARRLERQASSASAPRKRSMSAASL